jgi:hypothetical protein
MRAVYRLTVYRCEARIGRVWLPYGQVYMDIRHIRIHQSISKRCVGDLNTNDVPLSTGVTTVSKMMASFKAMTQPPSTRGYPTS